MHRVLVHRGGRTEEASAVDPGWLAADAAPIVWVDIEHPDGQDRRLLHDVFKFHELAIEDAIAELHHPKIETYDGLLDFFLRRFPDRHRRETSRIRSSWTARSRSA